MTYGPTNGFINVVNFTNSIVVVRIWTISWQNISCHWTKSWYFFSLNKSPHEMMSSHVIKPHVCFDRWLSWLNSCSKFFLDIYSLDRNEKWILRCLQNISTTKFQYSKRNWLKFCLSYEQFWNWKLYESLLLHHFKLIVMENRSVGSRKKWNHRYLLITEQTQQLKTEIKSGYQIVPNPSTTLLFL